MIRRLLFLALLVVPACDKTPPPVMPKSAAAILAEKGDSCGKDRNTWEWQQGGWPHYNSVEFECRNSKWSVSRITIREPNEAEADHVIKALRDAQAGASADTTKSPLLSGSGGTLFTGTGTVGTLSGAGTFASATTTFPLPVYVNEETTCWY